MAHEWNNLEREVDTGIDALASQLDARAPFEAIERARLAVRVALDERLLESRQMFIPQALRDRLRETIRHELGYGANVNRWHAWWQRHGRTLSALASVAMIGICIGVVRQVGGISHRTATDSFERFVDAGREVYAGELLTAGLDDALQDLDERIVQGPTESERVDDGLRQLEEMMDTLQNDVANDNGTL